MNAPIDTLAFAEKFEGVGFDRSQARALAAALGQASESGRDDLVARELLDVKAAELKSELLLMETRLVKQIADNGRELSGRLWSTIAVITAVSTAVSATIGAGVALLLKAGGI